MISAYAQQLTTDETLDARNPRLASRQVPLYIYFNNHYAGYAPGSVELFSRLWNAEQD